MRMVLFLGALLFTLGCGKRGGTNLIEMRPRPAGAPDVVILAVAGHNDPLSAVLCSFADNFASLVGVDEAPEAIARTFESQGLTTEVAQFSDRFESVPGDPARAGFLDLIATMKTVHDDWIDHVENPTRIVLVAHSHGTNWTHIATSILPDIPVDYLITLDGICLLWECEHDTAIEDSGLAFPWDIRFPCDRWTIPGRVTPYNTKDVAFPNVRVHLEVRSDDPFVFDSTNNVRLDGTLDGVATFLAAGEGHTEVHAAGSAAVAFVIDAILASEP